jgi:hypothetical protein
MSWTWLSDTKPRARKQYHCDLCGRAIEHGQEHVARRGIGDDGPVTLRMHIICCEITKLYQWTDFDFENYDEAEFAVKVDAIKAERAQMLGDVREWRA